MAEPRSRGGKAAGKSRVAFVNTHPIQYFTPLYRHINRSDDLEAVPVFLSDHGLKDAVDPGFGQRVSWDIDLLEGLEPVFLPGADRRKLGRGAWRMVAPQVWSEIRGGGYDAVVVHGPAIPANYVALAAARSIGIPIFNRSETHLGLRRSAFGGTVRSLLVPHVYARFDGVLAIGSANRDFFLAMGVPEDRISMFPYTVDNDRLIAASRMDAGDRAAFRARIGAKEGRPAVLFVSKLQRRKRPDDLIRAARRLAAEGLEFDLIIAGTGEMESELKRLAAEGTDQGLNISFPGFFNQSEMPKLLGACDVFVLPSDNEPWGLIINEAMCASLPVVASREIGSVRDLVREDENGRLFEAGDIAGLADALRPILADPALRERMGRKSGEIISQWNYQRCEEGLRDALAKAGV